MTLRQVIDNLLANVRTHTPSGTPTVVRVRTGGDVAPGGLVLEVADEGPGLDPEHLDRVFERFYRVDASRTRGGTAGGGTGGGAGLGMAIVAAIVTAHRGDVSLAQTPGGGTTVRVALPLARPGEGDDGAADDADEAGTEVDDARTTTASGEDEH